MTSPFGPIVLIGSGRSRRLTRLLDEVEAYLRERGLEYELGDSGGSASATRAAREALQAGRRFLVAVGGDGTVHQVVNGMIQDDRALSSQAVLGVVPDDMGCDFVKTFGIPEAPGHAVAHLDGPESFPIDVGKVAYTADGKQTTRYFANVAEAGTGARVAAIARKLRRSLGAMGYPVALWLALTRHRAASVGVDLVDRTYEGKMNNLLVANGQFFRAGMKVAPRATPTDGLLDIQIEHATKREVIATMPRMYKGEHVPHPDILEAKRVRCSIEADPPLLVAADGEVLGSTPARFEVLRNALALKV